jgi:hypothetical protein
MPPVRIDAVEGRSDGESRGLADVVQEVVHDAFAAPDRECYRVIPNPGECFARIRGEK